MANFLPPSDISHKIVHHHDCITVCRKGNKIRSAVQCTDGDYNAAKSRWC